MNAEYIAALQQAEFALRRALELARFAMVDQLDPHEREHALTPFMMVNVSLDEMNLLAAILTGEVPYYTGLPEDDPRRQTFLDLLRRVQILLIAKEVLGKKEENQETTQPKGCGKTIN